MKVMKFRCRILLFIIIVSVGCYAIPADSTMLRHEVRVGWGDMLFETAVFHDSPLHRWANPEYISPQYTILEKHNHSYTGHFFVEYRYSFKWWLSLGFQADLQGIFWKETEYDRYHNAVSGTTEMKNFDLTLMPTLCFTFFRGKWVDLFAGISGGLLIAMDNHSGCEPAPAFALNLLGLSVGKGHWSGSAELGMMGALLNTQKIYMLGSRLFAVSLNYSF